MTRILCAFSCLCLSSQADRLFGADLLAEARAGNKSALEAIQTFSCKVKVIKGNGFESLNETGQYWRCNDAVRVRGSIGGLQFDALQQGSVVRSIGTKSSFVGGKLKASSPSAPERVGSIIPATGPLPGCDVWNRGLLRFTGPISESGSGFKMMPFDELMAECPRSLSVKRRTEEGVAYTVVAYSDQGSRVRYDYEIWLNPQINYLAAKWVIKEVGKSGKALPATEHRILKFAEVLPGIFFPEVSESKTLDGTFLQSAVFSDIKINQPVPPELFDFRFPSGIEVFDAIEGKSYKIGADGNPSGPFKELEPPVSQEQVEALSATVEEPKSWTRWILPSGVALLILGVLLWAVQKRSAALRTS